MRRFVLIRHVDVNGVSGEGVIVWGCQWPDGRVSYRWNTPTATSSAADSIDDVVQIHGHGGYTQLVWLDTDAGGRLWRLLEDLHETGGDPEATAITPSIEPYPTEVIAAVRDDQTLTAPLRALRGDGPA